MELSTLNLIFFLKLQIISKGLNHLVFNQFLTVSLKFTFVGYQCSFFKKKAASQNVAAPQSYLLKKHEMNINSVLLSCEKNKTM